MNPLQPRFGGFYPLNVKTPDGTPETDLDEVYEALTQNGWGDEVAGWLNMFGGSESDYAVFRHDTGKGKQLVLVTDDDLSRDCTDVLSHLTIEQNILASDKGILPKGMLAYKMGEGNVTPMEVTYNADVGNYGFANPFYGLKFKEEQPK